MKSIHCFANLPVFGIAALLLTACANQMAPAKQALDEIYNVEIATTADASKYVPDEMVSFHKEIGDLQSSYDKQDYAAVLAHAPAVLADAKNLAAAAAAKKGEIAKALETEWSGLAASLPQWITTVKDRVEVLSKPKRVPKGIDLAAAKSGLADATDGWARAQGAKASGEVDSAIATAKAGKSKIEVAAAALKLELAGTDK